MQDITTDFLPLTTRTPSRGVYICIGCLIITHLILMTILVATVATIAPEMKSTLADVQIIMPEMRRSLLELGQLVPQIESGMEILQQLCHSSTTCHVVPTGQNGVF